MSLGRIMHDQSLDNQIHGNLFSTRSSSNEEYINISVEQCDVPGEALGMALEEKSLLERRKRKTSEHQKSKKKVFAKKFRKEWMDEPLFKGWLQPVPSYPDKSYCSVCHVILLAGHSELEKHASGKKHCELLLSGFTAVESIDKPEFVLVDQKDDIDSDNTTEDAELVSDRDFVYFENGTILPQNRPTAKLKFAAGSMGLKTASSKSNNRKSLKSSNKESKDFHIFNDGKVIATAQLVLPNAKASALPENPDAEKLLHCLNSDSEDDESLYDLEDSAHLLREMRAELAYGEKKRSDEPFNAKESRTRSPLVGRPRDPEEHQRYLAEKEMEAKLRLIEERRKQNLNIYKLKLIEMEAKIRLAEAELERSAEIHKFRLEKLKNPCLQEQS